MYGESLLQYHLAGYRGGGGHVTFNLVLFVLICVLIDVLLLCVRLYLVHVLLGLRRLPVCIMSLILEQITSTSAYQKVHTNKQRLTGTCGGTEGSIPASLLADGLFKLTLGVTVHA